MRNKRLKGVFLKKREITECLNSKNDPVKRGTMMKLVGESCRNQVLNRQEHKTWWVVGKVDLCQEHTQLIRGKERTLGDRIMCEGRRIWQWGEEVLLF